MSFVCCLVVMRDVFELLGKYLLYVLGNGCNSCRHENSFRLKKGKLFWEVYKG